MTMPSSPPYQKFTNFILSHGATTVSINRRPAYGDTHQLVSNRIFYDNNDFRVSFRSDNWPKYQVIDIDIFPITKTQADSIESFIIQKLGEIVTMTVNNIQYQGIIKEPKIELIDEKSNNCNFKVTFVFETTSV